MNEKTQTSLADAFKARHSTIVNRASCIYPLRQRENADCVIVFMNYWKLKNNVSNVSANFRVYDESGKCYAQKAFSILNNHFELSMRELVARKNFDGMVEVEIVSSENIVFAFPATLAFYRGGDAWSVVHSAGRVKNSDEPVKNLVSEETNFSCKFRKGIRPFFHIFNGPISRSADSYRARLVDSSGSQIEEKLFSSGCQRSFSSKIFFADEIFSKEAFSDASRSEECFMSLEQPNQEFFPRLVVGNFHEESELIEVTHSFPWTKIPDYVTDPSLAGKDPNSLWSFFPAIQAPMLDLELVSFPTNAPADVKGSVRRQRIGDVSLRETSERIEWRAGGEGAKLLKLRLSPEETLVNLDFLGGQIPSRLNSSYRYSVRGVHSPYSTDIATGAKSWVYPPKHTQWGHGIVGGGWKTVIMARNIAHEPSKRSADSGLIQFYWADGGVTQPSKVKIEMESALVLDLPKEIQNLQLSEKPRFISWMMKMEKPNVETFWVSYTDDGRICGEHGF